VTRDGSKPIATGTAAAPRPSPPTLPKAPPPPAVGKVPAPPPIATRPPPPAVREPGRPVAVPRDPTKPITTTRVPTAAARPAAPTRAASPLPAAPPAPALRVGSASAAVPKPERSRFRALHKMWRHPLGEVSGGTDASTGARIQVMALNPGSVISDAQLDAGRAAARVAASVSSPGVVRPIDIQRMADGRIAIATEPLEGTPLTNVSRNQPLPATRTVAVLRQLCKALASVHEVGLVHRALTLGSLVLRTRSDRPDTVAVTDFGIGPLLDGDVAILKEDAAMQPVSPERLSGAQQDIREDLYLMGCIAYSLFTGGAPFRTGTADAVRRRHAIEDPMPIADRLKGTRGVHPALAAWVHRCLAKEPDDRFEDAMQAEAALCLAQIEAHVETPWDDLPPPDVETATVERITAGLRRRPAAAVAPSEAEYDDDVTILRRPSHPSPEGPKPEGQTTVVRMIDAEPVEVPDDVGSMPLGLDGSGVDGFERSDTVVSRAEDTVAGARPEALEDTSVGAIASSDDDTSVGPVDATAELDDQHEQTRRAAMAHEDTAVGPAAARDDTVSALVHGIAPRPSPKPAVSPEGVAPAMPVAPAVPVAPAMPVAPAVPEFDLEAVFEPGPFEIDPADRTQISRAPAAPFSPAPLITPEVPDAGDRTMVAPLDVVTFAAPIVEASPARAPSSTPTVPAGVAIDPRVLPSSTSTLPGTTAPQQAPVVEAPRAPAPSAMAEAIARVMEAAPRGAATPPSVLPAPPLPTPARVEVSTPIPPPMPIEVPAPIASAPIASAPIASAPIAAAPIAVAPIPPAPIAAAPIAAAPIAAAPIAPAPPVSSALPPMVVPAGVLPPSVAPPWPSSPSGLTGQYTSANASFSASDMDASMVASIGGRGRTLKLVAVVLGVAVVVGGGLLYILRPPASDPAPPVAVADKAPPPVRVEKVTAPVDDIAADVAATPNDLVAAGDRAMGDGRADDAESLYQRAIVREPKHLGALVGLGRMQLAKGDVDKAASYFRRAVGANPNDGAARVGLGDALAKQGNVAEARKQYKKAKALKHPDASARLGSL
jgi:serine/threonine protein kinase